MRISLTSLCLAAIVAGMAPARAADQPARNCADRGDVLKRLSGNYGETRQSVGLGANNSLVEVFASDKTGTWTITVTMPDGMTCLIASGQAYEKLLGDKLLRPGEDA
ncbi:hypothetical protein [Mangrovicoccus algicola]|uniref:Uncharacterized protein n=1 Tax=Mangrovicoccus algicola TaxID=2771008 RepID=A0A8J7CFY2_9RHOB|nr:hypothetical protein [Mangrovicoccus algicola]MBE3636690.1 hypothetical protein [Mangrovicoccus algicola]